MIFEPTTTYKIRLSDGTFYTGLIEEIDETFLRIHTERNETVTINKKFLTQAMKTTTRTGEQNNTTRKEEETDEKIMTTREESDKDDDYYNKEEDYDTTYEEI